MKLFGQVYDEVKTRFYVLDEENNLQPHPGISLVFLNQIRNYYETACSACQAEILKLVEKTKQMIDLFGPPNLLFECLKKLDIATNILSTHRRVDKLFEKNTRLLSYFLTHLSETAGQSVTYIYPDKNKSPDELIPIIAKFCSFLSAVQELPDIDNTILGGLRKIKEINDHFLYMASQQ